MAPCLSARSGGFQVLGISVKIPNGFNTVANRRPCAMAGTRVKLFYSVCRRICLKGHSIRASFLFFFPVFGEGIRN